MTPIISVKAGTVFGPRSAANTSGRPPFHRRAGAAFMTWGALALACRPDNAERRVQEDTGAEQIGGAPAACSDPSLPFQQGGNGGSAGAASIPEQKQLRIPCNIETILERYCLKCHGDRIEPRLDLYETATAVSREIRGALVGTGPREMPPREHLPDDLRQQIVDWINAGTPPASSEATCPQQ